MAEELDPTRTGRIRFRLDLADALIWAVEHPDELVSIVRSSRNGAEALDALSSPPWGLSEAVAHHVLDMPFRRLTIENVSILREWREKLARGEDVDYIFTWQP